MHTEKYDNLNTLKKTFETISTFDTAIAKNLFGAYLISVGYNKEKKVAYLKFYEPKSKRIFFWYDETGHNPYCLSDLKPDELKQIDNLITHPGFDHFEIVEKYDPLKDKFSKLTKIVTKDPASIGGQGGGRHIRDIIPKAWEANIRYYESYMYDRGLIPCMPYDVKEGKIVKSGYRVSDELLKEINSLFKDEDREFLDYINQWIDLFECPVPDFRRVAVDIEVSSPVRTRVPNPETASEPIVAISLIGSDGFGKNLLLKRDGVKEGNEKLPEGVKVEYYDREDEMLLEVFKTLLDYPIVLTFNGDDFDLPYIYHRAEKIGFPREKIPIEVGRDATLLKYGIHIDLYKFFFNRSMQIYAFSRKYTEVTLDAISRALLGTGKIKIEKPISELTYSELANYCIQDATITLDLTRFSDNLVMRLITVLSRISRLSMEDVTRQGVSGWIKSLMYFEHRKRNWLIPRLEDILEIKGVTSTKAIIEGKKYRGATVVKPSPGVHFNVAVLDFASLYPSIIKRWNLSYETVLCSHKECKDNVIPETPYWVCRKRKGITSLVIGSLRDLRVKWYKLKSKDKNLSSALRNWYDVIQCSLKVILNASYGVFGAEIFAFYCPPVAESTASIGRYLINKTIEEAQKLGIEVVYGDTDSVFLENPSAKQIDELTKWSRESLGMELDVDKTYRYSVFSTRKKNYLGVYPDGSVDIKGLTGKKKNTPNFLQSAFIEMTKTLGEVKTPKDFEDAKEKIKRIVKECYTKMKRGEYKLEDLAFNVTMGKSTEGYIKTTPQHVKAARQLSETGYDIKPGDIISFVKVIGSPGVKPTQLASSQEIDSEKYMNYIESTFEQVLDAIGLDFNEIIGLTRLESFLWGENYTNKQ